MKIAKKKTIIFDFKIKLYIIVVIYNTIFDDKIIDDEIEIKSKKKSKLQRMLKISLIVISINCIKIKFELFIKIIKNNKSQTRLYRKIKIRY